MNLSNEKTTLTLKDGSTVKYFSHPMVFYGDYSDTGSVGKANVQTLEKQYADFLSVGCFRYDTLELDGFPTFTGKYEGGVWTKVYPETAPLLVKVYESFGTVVLFFRADILDATAYPETEDNEAGRAAAAAYNLRESLEGLDDYASLDDDMVSEIELEWEGEAWEGHVKHELLGNLPEGVQEKAESLEDEVLFACYREAMDKTNSYPTPECSGVYIDTDRIAEAFREAVGGRVATEAGATVEDVYWKDRIPAGTPPRVVAAIKRVYGSYPAECLPQGVCDPMYMMNIIALELGIGDGQGHFNLPGER